MQLRVVELLTTVIQPSKAPVVPSLAHHSAARIRLCIHVITLINNYYMYICNVYYLVPTYKQQLKQVKPTVKRRRRHFAAALNALTGVCLKRPQPTFINTVSQRLHHLLRRPVHSNENDNNDKPWFNTYIIKHKLQAK